MATTKLRAVIALASVFLSSGILRPVTGIVGTAKTFTFPEFPYKETGKNHGGEIVYVTVEGLKRKKEVQLAATKYDIRGKDCVIVGYVLFRYIADGQELLFREFEQACEQSGACRMLQQQENGIAKIRCIRECVSPSCYQEIYVPDQLEEGEIDVRLNSFKGCFMQRSGRPRK